MVVNTIIGTGGDMSQIHRSAVNEKSNAHHINLVGIGVSQIMSNTEENVEEMVVNDRNIVDKIMDLDVTIIDRTVIIEQDTVPVIIANAVETIHQYAAISIANTAIDIAIDHTGE